MKALITVAIRQEGLKLLSVINTRSRSLSYAGAAICVPTSSEDEDLTAEAYSASKVTSWHYLNCCSAEIRQGNIYSSGPNSLHHVYTPALNLTSNYRKINVTERNKLILMKHKRSVEVCVEFGEERGIKALKALFAESMDAALALQFFQWLEAKVGFKHTVRSVCVMVRILLIGNMNYRAMDLLSSLIQSHSGEIKQHDFLLNTLQEICGEKRILEIVCSMVVKCYVEEAMIDAGIRLICEMDPLGIFPSAGVCNMLIKSLLVTDKVVLAWDLLEEMHKREMVNASIISLFICHYCRKGEVQCGWKLLMDMKYYGVRPDFVAYTIVIGSLCKEFYVKEAASLLFKMVQMAILPDQVLLSLIIDGFCKVGMPEKSISIAKVFNVSRSKFLYSTFISKLCKDGDMLQAADIFEEMCNYGLRPDCFIYTALINGYLRLNDQSTAFKYLGRMLKCGVKPSVATYTVLIKSFCLSGDLKMSDSLYISMLKEGLEPDIIAYNTLINGYGMKGMLQEAFELLNVMHSAGVTPDIVTYNSIIHSLVVSGFVNEATHILNELILREPSPDAVTFTNIIIGYCIKGQFRKAFSIWSSMGEYNLKPDVVTCSAVLNKCCRAGCIDEASTLFDHALATGILPDIIMYNTMIHGLCLLGRIDESRHFICMMLDQNIIPNDVTYQSLILGFEKNFVKDPVRSAAMELKHILQKHGLNFVVDERDNIAAKVVLELVALHGHIQK